MLRVLGGCMIISGSLGLGIWYREQWRIRLRQLQLLREMLELIMSEVRYGRATLPECCLMLAGRTPEPYATCFARIHTDMRENNGSSFETVFLTHMRACLDRFPLTEEDCACFLHFVEGEAVAEGSMQLRILEQEREQLQGIIEGLEQELASKSRLAVGLGAMSGLLLIIILW